MALKSELEFIERAVQTAENVESYVAAARSAVKLAAKAAKELQALFPLREVERGTHAGMRAMQTVHVPACRAPSPCATSPNRTTITGSDRC